MWKKGILREFKDTLQPVQHQGKDPGRTRNKAWKAIKGQMDDAGKKGKTVVYRVEGRTKKHKAGDPAMERLARYHAKKHGIKINADDEKATLEKRTKAGGKKAQRIAKKYNSDDGDYAAYPEDDPSGKTKSSKLSRAIERWNSARRRHFKKIVKSDKKKGHVTVGTLGAGHFEEAQGTPVERAERLAVSFKRRADAEMDKGVFLGKRTKMSVKMVGILARLKAREAYRKREQGQT